MNVVDSSGRLEFFGHGANADFFAGPLATLHTLIVPAVSIINAFKRVLHQRVEAAALQAAALMQQGQVVPLDPALAMAAAKLSSELKLPMADSAMLATARQFKAMPWSQDAEFEGLAGMRYLVRRHRDIET